MKRHPGDLFKAHVSKSIEVKEALLESCAPDVDSGCQLMLAALRSGCKILVCGNGGSAADAQHFAAELVGMLSHEARDRKALPAIALTTNSSNITAIGNDYGFERIFARQVEALGARGDVLLAITTSGNSPNILAAAQAARMKEMKVVGLTGQTGGGLVPHCDVCVRVPSNDTQLIQESHLCVEHVWAEYIESNFLP